MNLRAWIRRLDPGALLVIVAMMAVLAAILLSPPVPPTAYPPPSTVPYGQPGQLPDTMLDALEGRVYTLERELEETRRRLAQLEDR